MRDRVCSRIDAGSPPKTRPGLVFGTQKMPDRAGVMAELGEVAKPDGPEALPYGAAYLMKVNLAIADVPLPNGQSNDPLLGRAVARTRT